MATTLLVLALMLGCTTTTQFNLTSPSPTPPPLDADALVHLEAIRLNGALRTQAEFDPYAIMLDTMIASSRTLRATTDPALADASLEVTIRGNPSVKGQYYPQFIPFVPFFTRGFSQYGAMLGVEPDALGYNWAVTVDYALQDRDDRVVGSDQFQIHGQHGQRQNLLLMSAAMFVGSTPERIAYPNTETQLELSEKVIELAGEELVRRLSKAEPAAFFRKEEERRGGMSRLAYQQFRERQRVALARSAEKSEIASKEFEEAERSGLFDLKRSNVVVFGIGVNQYRSESFPDLAYAASDCNKVVGWFRQRYDLAGDQATCLTDEDATAVRINRYLKQNAARMLGPEDTFVFYFSGHGAPDTAVRSSDGDGLEKYLLVSNSEPDSLPLTGVNLTRLFDSIDQLPARRKIILIDSCFAGEAGKRVVAGLESARISQTSYENAIATSRAGTILIAASTENQVSLERDSLQSGLFTHHLVGGLSGLADGGDDDQEVDLMELYRHVSGAVSGDTGGRQTPILRGELDSNIEF